MANKYTRRSTARDKEDRVDRTYNRSGKRRGKSTAAQKRRSIIAICVALFLLIGLIAVGLYLFAESDNGLTLSNTYVAGIDVGDKTKEEVLSILQVQGPEKLASQNMKVTVLNDSIEITPEEAAVTVDWNAAAERAYELSRSGSTLDKLGSKIDAVTGNITVDISDLVRLDEDKVRDRLNELGDKYASTLKESTFSIEDDTSGETPLRKLVLVKGTPQYELDMKVLYEKVVTAYSEGVFAVTGECVVTEPNKIDFDAILQEYGTPAKDAVIDMENLLVLEPAEQGVGFDIAAAEEALANAVSGEKIVITFETLLPTVTEKDLEQFYYQDELCKFTTTASSEKDRNTNLHVACEAINGFILRPGEIFSYNDTLGERTEEKGYRPGPSYAGNDTVYSVGGGICQVSSTLYYCTLIAEMETVTRDEHQFYPGYIPFGMDAMVSWNSYDFQFKNTSDYPIRIEASASGGSVTIRIMGTDRRNYDVKMKHVILSTNNYQTVYRTMTADNADGYKDGDVIVSGYTGYKVKTYRCRYEKGTDKLLTEDYIATSEYAKRDKIVCKIETVTDDPVEETTPGTEETTPEIDNNNPGIIGGVTEGGGALPDE